MDNVLQSPQLHVLSCADDKHTEIGVAASTSLLIGVLVSVSEVCRHSAALNAFCMHTLSNPASHPVKQEARIIKLKPLQVQASASD